MKQKFTLLAILAICASTVQTMAQTMRLIATHRSYYFTNQGGWAPFDSAQFVYPSNNGGTADDFDLNQLKADTSFHRKYVAGNYVEEKIIVKAFDIQGRVTTITTYQYNSPNYEPSARTSYTYTTNNEIAEELTETHNGTAWENQYKTTNTYDVNNNITIMLTETWNTSWVGFQQRLYTYDLNNNMVTYKYLSWNSGNSTWDSSYYQHYYYTGNLQDSVYMYSWQSGWQTTQRYYLQYDVNEDNIYRRYQNWDANTSSWINSLQSFVTYDNHYVVIDSTMNWPANIGNWRYTYRYGYHYDNNWNMLSYYLQDWDTTNNVFVNNILDSMDYNGMYRIKRQSYTWDNTTNSYGAVDYNSIINYYYESYTADVSEASIGAGSLTLFPVPASNNLNIDMIWNKPQDFKVAIYDMQGRLISQTGEKATGHYRKSIPLYGMAAGTYILSIKGKDATVQEQFVIID